MFQILVPIREALRKLGAASAVTVAVRRERLDVGGSILIRGWTSSSIFLVEGDGVPQNRLMKADDSCRVENAGVKPLRCAAQASFCPSTQSKVTMSRASRRLRAPSGRSFVLGGDSWQHSEERAPQASGAVKQISRALKQDEACSGYDQRSHVGCPWQRPRRDSQILAVGLCCAACRRDISVGNRGRQCERRLFAWRPRSVRRQPWNFRRGETMAIRGDWHSRNLHHGIIL